MIAADAFISRKLYRAWKPNSLESESLEPYSEVVQGKPESSRFPESMPCLLYLI